MNTFRRTQQPSSSSSKLLFNSYGKECASIIESIDWSKHTFGPMEEWPQSLHITLGIILNTRFPMFIFWGPEHICFYNDAARFSIPGMHPYALGKKGETIWGKQWCEIEPMVRSVLSLGQSSWHEDECTSSITSYKTEQIFSTYSYSPIYNESGERAGVLVTGIETTEKVKSIKKLEESERNFRNLIEQAPIGIAILKGRDFVFEVANDNYLKLTGKSDRIIGVPLVKAIPEMAFQQFPDILMKVMLTGISYRGKEFQILLTRNGVEENVFVNFVYEPMKEPDGSIKRIMVTMVDVTEQVVARNKSEENHKELRKMADAMPQLVWLSTPEGTITYINNRIAEFSGATQTREGNWRWTGMLHPEDLDSTVAVWNNALRDGTLYEAEHRLNMLDGTYKWHLSRAYPYKNEEGEVIKWFGTATDIDEQKRISEQLELRVQERTKELQKSNNELAQFAYVASHDLQEPLRKISTFIEILGRNLSEVDDKSRIYLQKIESSSIRMSTLIKDILNFSQLSKAGAIFKPVDLNESLNSILTDFELVIQQKGAIVKADPLPEIQGIPSQINQLFYNLISNSFKFVEEKKEPVVVITSQKLSKEDASKYTDLNQDRTYYKIVLKDNGIGFDEKYAEQIFTLFQRLNTRQSYSGTGIGLALCKKIVMNHNGHIIASSAVNEGATFTIILPERQS